MSVSLTQLAQASPEWQSVRQIDRLEGAASVTVAPPAAAPPAGGATVVSPPPAQAGSVHPGLVAHRSETARRTAAALASSAQRAVAEVAARIERNQAQLLARERLAADLRVQAGVRAARQQAVSDYLASVPALIGADSARRVNLNVQVKALQVDANPTNPPTAPDDHWGHLLDARKAALARLGSPQTAAQQAADLQISQAVADAQARLRAASDAELAAYQATLDERRKTVLDRQRAALQREQVDLLAVSDALDEELAEPLAASDTAAPYASLASGGVDNAAVSTEGARYGMIRLAAQRQRLVTQILDDTRRRAARAALQVHLKIVGWNNPAPDQAQMRAIEAKMRENAAG